MEGVQHGGVTHQRERTPALVRDSEFIHVRAALRGRSPQSGLVTDVDGRRMGHFVMEEPIDVANTGATVELHLLFCQMVSMLLSVRRYDRSSTTKRGAEASDLGSGNAAIGP